MKNMRILVAFAIALVLVAAAPGGAQDLRSLEDIGLTDSELVTIVELARLDAALRVFEEHFGSLGRVAPDEWVDIGTLSDLIEPDFPDLSISEDGWGGPLLIRVVDGDYLLMSSGADGVGTSVEVVEGLIQRSDISMSPRELRAMVGDDLLFAQGQLVAGPRSTVQRIKTTMADMRTIATASEAYAVDWGHYPVLPEGLMRGESLRDFIQPIYIKRMPELDGWGNPFVLRYQASGYLIISTGSDGQLQDEYEGVALDSPIAEPSLYSEPADDIVYANGVFVSYPDEFVRR